MPSKKPTKAELKEKLLALTQDQAKAALTLEALADGHPMQLAILQCGAQNMLFQCSRRAGKTWVCLCLLLLTALASKNVICVFLGLDKLAVADQWLVWLRILDTYGIKASHADQVTTFANGSYVEFTGLDDLRRIQSFRGRNMAEGMLVIDEAQSDPGLIEITITDIFGHMLNETTAEHPTPGRLVVAGTIPDVEGVGYFEKLWLKHSVDPDSSWKCFNWSRFENPHETNNEKNLADYCKAFGFEVTDTYIQRTWFGKRVFGDAKTAYGWTLKNSYTPVSPIWLPSIQDAFPPGRIIAAQLPHGARFLSVGVDPGPKHDQTAVEAWAWGASGGGVWHVFEWITPHASGATQGDWAAVLGEIKRRFPGVTMFPPVYDAGSAQEVIDTFAKDYGIPMVLPAKKAALVGQVDRFKTLLRKGEAHVIKGSSLEYDLQVTQWDWTARERGQNKFSNQHHPNSSEAARYSLDSYYNLKPLDIGPTYASEAEKIDAEVRERFLKQIQNPSPPKKLIPSVWENRRTPAWGRVTT